MDTGIIVTIALALLTLMFILRPARSRKASAPTPMAPRATVPGNRAAVRARASTTTASRTGTTSRKRDDSGGEGGCGTYADSGHSSDHSGGEASCGGGEGGCGGGD